MTKFRHILEEAMDAQSGICKIKVASLHDLDSAWTNAMMAAFFKHGRTLTIKLYQSFLNVEGNEAKFEKEIFDYLARMGGNEIFKQEFDEEEECYIITVVRA